MFASQQESWYAGDASKAVSEHFGRWLCAQIVAAFQHCQFDNLQKHRSSFLQAKSIINKSIEMCKE